MHVFVQARMSSRRFPGKVLAPFRGLPIIDHVVAAVGRALPGAPLTVLTSDEPSDGPLAAYLATREIRCFRGSREDVLDRFRRCLAEHGDCEWVMRLCADSPVLSEVVLRAVAARLGAAAKRLDLVTTIAPRSFPRGQNAEIVRASTLRSLEGRDLEPADREHVTRYLHRHPARFRIVNVSSGKPELSELNLCVDTVEDLQRLSALEDDLVERYRRVAFWDASAG
jgi:spore coat polysaccharide biosynthesis protein SpsF